MTTNSSRSQGTAAAAKAGPPVRKQLRLDRSAEPAQPTTLVRPVRNAINVLRLLAASRQHLTATHVGRALELNGSTCFNILRTLVYMGVIEFDSGTKTYRTGLGAVELADKSLLTDRGVEPDTFAQLQELAQDFSVTVMVFRRISDSRTMVTGLIDSTAPVRIHVRLGQRFPLLAGSTGRVWAAFGEVSDKQVELQWPEIRWNNAPTPREYRAQVATVRMKRVATDDGGHVPGMYTVSAPVLRPGGSLLSVVTIGWPRGQLDAKTLRQLMARLKPLIGPPG